MSGPYQEVTAGDVRDSLAAIRTSLRALDKPRWWRSALALGRLQVKGLINAWPDVEWQIPQGAVLNRPSLVAAIADVFGGPAQRVCALDRAAGRALHKALGEPAKVIVDVGANPKAPARANQVQIAAVTGRSTTEVGVWVDIDDPALTWAAGPGQPREYTAAEYNPSNDFLQQQGLKSAYPLHELRDLGREAAAALIGQERRLCGYLVLLRRNGGLQPTCSINGEGCSYKSPVRQNRTAWGTGGPKVLLERREARPASVAPPRGPDDPHPEVDEVARRDNPHGLVLAPAWAQHLRRAMGTSSTHPPTVSDVATLIGWLHPSPDGPLARPRDLADLVSEDVMLAVCVR